MNDVVLTQEVPEESVTMAELLDACKPVAARRREILPGVVCRSRSGATTVGIGTKAEAEFKDAQEADDLGLQDGDAIEVMVLSEPDEDGMCLVSAKKARGFRTVQNMQMNGSTGRFPIMGLVTSRNKPSFPSGVEVDVNGTPGFVPLSHLAARGNTLKQLARAHEVITVVVLPDTDLYSEPRPTLVLSQYNAFPAGTVLTGTVTRVERYGGFLDLGEGLSGLLHATQIGIQAPVSALMAEGDKLEVEIVSIDPKARQISLKLTETGAKQLESKMAEKQAAKSSFIAGLTVGQTIRARVDGVAQCGAFVKLGPVTGLVPTAHISHRMVESPGDFVRRGDELDLVIINTNPANGTVMLSLRNANLDKQLASIEEGQIVKGRVSRLASYGAFVDIGHMDGLLHVSEVPGVPDAEGKTRPRALAVDEPVNVRIIRVDRENKKLNLSMMGVDQDEQPATA